MSQAKVDKYKQEKANRKEIMAKEKRQKAITKLCTGGVCAVIAAWIVISIGVVIYDNRPKDTIYVQTTEIEKYLESLDKDASTEK